MNKKILLIITMILMLSMSSVFAITEKEVQEMEKNSKVIELEPFIVQITEIGMRIGSCSGVVLQNDDNKTTILTCKHCIQLASEMYVDDVKVSSIHTAVNEDLAYLILENKLDNKKAVTISEHSAGIGTKVYMLGKPGIFINYFKSGEIKKYTNDWGFAKLEVIDGCSGTGIFNEKNELVGIVWGSYIEGSEGGNMFTPGIGGISIGMFEPIYDIKEFLYKINKILK
jgi:S1-C subfamily serine protease